MNSASDLVGIYAAADELAGLSRIFASLAHEIKFWLDWGVPPVPEFNDHFLNHYFLFPNLKRSFWLEGPIFCGLAIGDGVDRMLEMCCGSGFHTDLFYSPFAKEIIAVDFDPRSIEMASKFHRQANITYKLCDIRHELPNGPFDCIIFEAAIEHFTEAEIGTIMKRIKEIGAPNFVLSGYTVAEPDDAPQHPDHETHFAGLNQLDALLRKYFRNVRTFERIHPTLQPTRHNLFFYASDGLVPFDAEWPHGRR